MITTVHPVSMGRPVGLIARLVAIDPGFSISRWSAAVGIAPHISDTVTDALRLAGLPE